VLGVKLAYSPPSTLVLYSQYLTSHSSVELFGKGHQVSLQKALQNTVSFHLFISHGSLIIHSHPDKVRLTGNDTAESVAALFVEITKAYKA
jgi:hypothetical protein